jgi:hypothetical protein
MSKTLPFSSMTSPIDCSSIKNVCFTFSNVLLNTNASDDAHDYDDFFDETGVVLDPNLLSMINAQVHKLVELCNGDPSRISAIVNKFHHKFFSHDSGSTI